MAFGSNSLVLVILGTLLVHRAFCVSPLASMFDSLDDTIHYTVKWPEDDTSKESMMMVGNERETVNLITSRQEQYRCLLPEQQLEESVVTSSDGDGDISAHSLLADVFKSEKCSLLIESYWTYELCHGKHLRQFHEVRGKNGQVVKLTEYYLGYYDNKPPTQTAQSGTLPKWPYNQVEYPYHGVELVGGTPCDLKQGDPRTTEVVYLCNEELGMGAEPLLFILLETSTCRYQAAVFTNELCQNKHFIPKKRSVHAIKCFPKDGSPSQPVMVQEHEALSTFLKPETAPVQFSDDITNSREQQTLREANVKLDSSYVKGFLSAEFCLPGKPSGWWKNELCFGEHVKQVHLENGIVTQKVFLGMWDKESHKKWFADANSKTKQSKRHVTHWYGNGDICELTGAPRHCLVRFKCIEGSGVSTSLQEPTACSYILTVEGGFICNLLQHIDEHGLFALPDSS